MYKYEAVSINEAWYRLLEELLTVGYAVSPRGQDTLELSPVSITLQYPRQRVLSSPERKLNYAFSVAEFLWMLRGSDDLEEIAFYNRQLRRFSDDGHTLRGAYGPRLLRWPALKATVLDGHTVYTPTEVNQLETVLERLRADPHSRHGTVMIWDPARDTQPSLDLPCTNLFRFKVRDGCLDMVTFMRSNDVWLGFPYDVFNFTLLQEVMADRLGVELGTYTHVVDSLHLYETHREAARDIVDHQLHDIYGKLAPRSAFLGDKQANVLTRVMDAERAARAGDWPTVTHHLTRVASISAYWANLIAVVAQHAADKLKDGLAPDYTPFLVGEHDALRRLHDQSRMLKEPLPMSEQPFNTIDLADTASPATEDDTSFMATAQAVTQPPANQIQKVTFETDGTLPGTTLKINDNFVPFLASINIVVSNEQGISIQLQQLRVDENQQPIQEDGRYLVENLTISAAAPTPPADPVQP